MEVLVAIIGAIIGLFAYRFFGQRNVDSEQTKLEASIKLINKKDASLVDSLNEITKEESKKIEEITNEQNKNKSSDDLVDFFRNNKGGK
jgi:septal ring factor EnvC (AmiA/AmiB activator)